MRSILVFILLSISFTIHASHIVGGELQLRFVAGTNYQINLNFYYDAVNGDPQAIDVQALVGIYEKGSNKIINSVFLDKISENFISYTNINCENPALKTKYVRYAATISLDPTVYTNPTGYYMIWERCCRNQTISNIDNPGQIGTAFYLEFPPVQKNNTAFINSSPNFNTPKGDYVCINQPFVFDFMAQDADNDVLKYMLTTPLSGTSSDLVPAPSTYNFYPYPPSQVSWSGGFDANNAIPGAPPLTIDQNTGILNVTANSLGLFVFSVVCEEYRNNEKIGEVRRDYQLLVIDCPSNASPEVKLQLPNSNNFYQEGQNIVLDLKVDSCLTLYVKDLDLPENVSISILPVNFTYDAFSITPAGGITQGANDSLQVTFCWPKCLYSENNNPFVIDIIAKDDGCPQSKADTLRVNVVVPPIVDQPPSISTNLPNNAAILKIGETIEFNVTGIDPEQALIHIYLVGNGFNPKSVKMFFENKTGLSPLNSDFSWTPDCSLIKINGEEKTYNLDFIVEDLASCKRNADTVRVNLLIKDDFVDLSNFLPPNIFTPNGDQKNDFFHMPNLPEENCVLKFKNIAIYNRWGKKVYENKERNFQWEGKDFPTGIYFYHLDYEAMQYKGTVSILK